jgi:hypothetical protein
LPEVVVAPGLFLGERPVLVFLVFIFIFLIKNIMSLLNYKLITGRKINCLTL